MLGRIKWMFLSGPSTTGFPKHTAFLLMLSVSSRKFFFLKNTLLSTSEQYISLIILLYDTTLQLYDTTLQLSIKLLPC